jgi:hypothetical protein
VRLAGDDRVAVTLPGMEPLRCQRHPDTETYLRCSSCDTPICPDCGVAAAVGYHCPDCSASRGTPTESRTARRPTGFGRAAGAGDGQGTPRGGQQAPRGEGMPPALVARTVAVGVSAMVLGGLLLGPIMQQGTLFLISSGIIGWGVARATYWGANEQTTPLVRNLALAFAGATAAVGLLTAGGPSVEAGLLFLAYPAALYGGWIAVRGR